MKRRPLSLGFSPCPNDCFIFDALLHGKVDTEGLSFLPVIEDVESLNKKAFQNALDVTKLSFFTYAKVRKTYSLLHSGAALGYGAGPLVIAKQPNPGLENAKLKIAIPGKNTTANLLFSLAYPRLRNKKVFLFSEIEKAVANGQADLGVIIHESRFTYKKKGLIKITDLGDFWEKKTGMPVPLGCMAVKSSLPLSLRKKIERIIRRSVVFALNHPSSSKTFVTKHAQEMEDSVLRRHIALYVNRFSVSMGKKGRAAVNRLMKEIH